MRNAAIADTSATHNHSKEKNFLKLFNLLNRGAISIFTEQIKRRLFRRHLLIICEEEIVLDNIPSFQYTS
jgi:hypothetical protein